MQIAWDPPRSWCGKRLRRAGLTHKRAHRFRRTRFANQPDVEMNQEVKCSCWELWWKTFLPPKAHPVAETVCAATRAPTYQVTLHTCQLIDGFPYRGSQLSFGSKVHGMLHVACQLSQALIWGQRKAVVGGKAVQRRPRIGASWSKCLLQQWEIAQHPRAPFSCHTTRRTVRLGRPILAPKAQLSRRSAWRREPRRHGEA